MFILAPSNHKHNILLDHELNKQGRSGTKATPSKTPSCKSAAVNANKEASRPHTKENPPNSSPTTMASLTSAQHPLGQVTEQTNNLEEKLLVLEGEMIYY